MDIDTSMWEKFGDTVWLRRNTSTCDAAWYPETCQLHLSESGKDFDDHAVAIFSCNSLQDAEYVTCRCVNVRTV